MRKEKRKDNSRWWLRKWQRTLKPEDRWQQRELASRRENRSHLSRKLHIWPTLTASAWKHIGPGCLNSPGSYRCHAFLHNGTILLFLGDHLCALCINSFNGPNNLLRTLHPHFLDKVTKLQKGWAAIHLSSKSTRRKARYDWQNSKMSPHIPTHWWRDSEEPPPF